MRRALLLLAVSLAAAVRAQPGAPAGTVVFPVTVVDASGKPVRGLTAANFALYDEKRKQTLTSLDVVDFAANGSSSAVAPMNPAARRSFVLLFDLGFTSPQSFPRAAGAGPAVC